jgi:hypothetical protein
LVTGASRGKIARRQHLAQILRGGGTHPQTQHGLDTGIELHKE